MHSHLKRTMVPKQSWLTDSEAIRKNRLLDFPLIYFLRKIYLQLTEFQRSTKVIQSKAEGLGNKADEGDEDGVFVSEEQRGF